MAEIDPVILQIRADMNAYRAELRSSTTLATASFAQQQRAIQTLEREIARSSGAISGQLRTLAGTFAGAFSVQQVAGMADSYTRFTNQLKQAGLEGTSLAGVQSQLFDIAQRNMVPLESLGTLYGRAAQSSRNLGASQEELIQFTRSVSAALKINDGSAESTSGALMQLGQALGGVNVTAEEYNSIQEGARPILQAVALGIQGLGGDVNKLRQEMLAGRLQSKELFDGIVAGMGQMEERAARATPTISGAFTVLTNALTRFVGETDSANGATARISQAIILLADNLGTITQALTVLGSVLIGRVVAGMVATASASAATGTAMFALQARAAGAATTMEALAFTSRAAGASMLAAFGGYVGLAVGAISLALVYLATRTQEAKADIQRFGEQGTVLRDRLAALDTVARQAASGIATVGQQANVARGQMLQFAGAIGEAATRLHALAVQRRDEQVAGFRQSYNDAFDQARDARARIRARTNQYQPGPGRDLAALQAADAQDNAIIDAATRRAQSAHRGRLAAEAVPLESRLLESEREGRDVSGELARVTADLVIARRAGVRATIQTLEAQKYELEQYRRYRTQGLSPAAARDASQRDQGTFRNADAQGNARRDAPSANERPKWASPQQAIQWLGGVMQGMGMRPRENFAYGRVGEHPGMGRQEHGERAIDVSGSREQILAMIETAQAQGFRALYDGWVYEKGGNGRTRRIPEGQNQHRGHGHFEAPRDITSRARAGSDEAVQLEQAAAQATLQAAEQEAQRAAAVAAEQRQLDDALFQARRGLVTSAEQQEEFANREIEIARDRYNADLTRRQGLGELTKAESGQLRAANAQVVELQLQAVSLERRRRLEAEAADAAARALELDTGDLERRQEFLQAASQMATTARERRSLELQLLDLQMQEQRLRLRAVIAAADRVLAAESTATAEQRLAAAAEREVATRGLAQVDALEPSRRQEVLRDTAGPAEDYVGSLRRTAEQLDEDFERVAVGGLERFHDTLSDSIASVFELGGAFGEVANSIIADLIRIAVQRTIIEPLANALFPTGNSGAGGGGLLSTLGILFGGGGGNGFVAPSSSTGAWFQGLGPGRASGGYVGPGQAVRVNEGASPGRVEGLVMGGQGGTVIPLGQMQASPGVRAPIVVKQYFTLDARGGITTTELLQHVNNVAGEAAEAGARGGHERAMKSLAKQRRQAL